MGSGGLDLDRDRRADTQRHRAGDMPLSVRDLLARQRGGPARLEAIDIRPAPVHAHQRLVSSSGGTMSALRVALDRWEAALSHAHVPAARHLRAGLDAGEVEDVLRGEGLQAVPDVVTFFSWHNGYAAGRPNYAILDPGGGSLHPFSEALVDYRANQAANPPDMDSGWFPIMTRIGGWLAIDCRPDSGSPGQLRVWT